MSTMTPNSPPAPPPARRGVRAAWKIAVTAVLLLVIARSLDWSAAWRQLSDVNLALLGISATVWLAGQFIAAWRLGQIFAALNRPTPLSYAIEAHLVGNWFNQLLPTGVGGDAVKVLLLRTRMETGRAFRAVVIHRLIGFMALATAVVLVWPFYETEGTRSGAINASAYTSLSVLAVFLVMITASHIRGLINAIPKMLRPLIVGLRDFGRFARPRRFVAQALTSLAVVAIQVTAFWINGLAIGLDIPFTVYLMFVPLIVFAMFLPISYAGWGVREATAIALFTSVGVDPATALLLSALYGAIIFVAALPGLILWHWPQATTHPKHL